MKGPGLNTDHIGVLNVDACTCHLQRSALTKLGLLALAASRVRVMDAELTSKVDSGDP